MAYTNVWTTAAPLDTQAANQGAVDFRATKLDVMQRIASFGAGLFANRPTPEATSASANWTGVMYWSTDTQQTFRWNGASWDDITASLPSGVAHFLATTGADVNVDLAAPPTAGQVLEATDATHATWQTLPGTFIFSNAATVNVPANTSENIIYTGTVVANSLGATGGFKVSFLVGSDGSAGTVTVRVKLGGVTIATTILANGYAGTALFEVTLLNITSGTQTTLLVVTSFKAATDPIFSVSGTAIDTTVNKTLQVTAEMSDAGHSSSFDMGYCTIL